MRLPELEESLKTSSWSLIWYTKMHQEKVLWRAGGTVRTGAHKSQKWVQCLLPAISLSPGFEILTQVKGMKKISMLLVVTTRVTLWIGTECGYVPWNANHLAEKTGPKSMVSDHHSEE